LRIFSAAASSFFLEIHKVFLQKNAFSAAKNLSHIRLADRLIPHLMTRHTDVIADL